MEPTWYWNLKTKRYHDLATGRFLSREQVLGLVDDVVVFADAAGSAATTLLANGQLNVADWQFVIRQELKDAYIQQYVLGKGGLEQMTAADWGSVGGMLGEQYRYLDKFAAEIAAGNLSEAQIQARLDMYFNSSREAYERAHARAYGVLDLPAYPGDGQTVCLTNCHCAWRIEELTEGGWACTWVLSPLVENCPDCIENAMTWNPLLVY